MEVLSEFTFDFLMFEGFVASFESNIRKFCISESPRID